MREYLDVLHGVLRYSHVAAGFLGLALFWVPIFARKGGPLHIRCGRWFVWIAYYMSGRRPWSPRCGVFAIRPAFSARPGRPSAPEAGLLFLQPTMLPLP